MKWNLMFRDEFEKKKQINQENDSKQKNNN
jgi:hypothetical protein